MKKILKKVVPPIFIDIIRKINKYNYGGVKGTYKSYEDANDFLIKKGMDNYSSDVILKKVYSAIEKVRAGEAEFERDSVLFYKKEYNYPLLASICYTLSMFGADNSANILDFGGSLGSTFFQNRDKLSGYKFKWHIVEQLNFVEFGKEHIPEIAFYDSIEKYRKFNSCDICILSGVIQYFDKPYDWLERILLAKFRYIIVDRILFSGDNGEQCSIQYVPSEIYDGQYPIWLLSRQKVIDFITSFGYELDDAWKSFDMMPVLKDVFGIEVVQKILQSEGFLFKLREKIDK